MWYYLTVSYAHLSISGSSSGWTLTMSRNFVAEVVDFDMALFMLGIFQELSFEDRRGGGDRGHAIML